MSPADAVPVLTKDDMRAALNGAMLMLRYQPLVRLADRTPIGVEALARLDHAKHGMLSADQFVPQMEAAGLSRLLTRTMITQALHQVRSHGLVELGMRVGLNVPLNVLMMPDMLELLETQRQKCAIPASQIVVELTETQPVTDHDALRGVVRRLRDIGYRVAIDDASPAMANIGALLEMAFTTLKFDKSVVRHARHDPDCRAFIEDIAKAAKASKIQTVAEGIEDQETQDLMRALGLDSAQGYFFARPLPIAAVKLWLNSWQPG